MIELNRFLPERLVTLRPMMRDDAPLLAHWIQEGRRAGVFRLGAPLTSNSVLDYQSKLGEKSQYYCLIAEDEGTPAGYLDYQYCLPAGEILGFYLEPRLRKKGIGRHLLRWVSAFLRECGCKRLDIEVYADNLVSLGVCQAAGFQCDSTATRLEDSRIVHRLTRSLSQFKRFCPPNPQYKSLIGDHRYFDHVAIAEAMAGRFREISGVDIILGLGSVGRGFADQWSDIDLAVLGRGAGLDELWKGEIWTSGLSLDLSVVDLDASPPEHWDIGRRQAFQEAVVLYEIDSQRSTDLESALRLTTEERRAEILTILLNLGWIGFQPRAWTGRSVYGYTWALPHDLWLRRGCLASAQATIDQALDLTIRLIYLANFRYVPDEKWRRFLLLSLSWLPEGFADLLSRVEEQRFEEANFHSRAEALLSLITETVAHLECTGEISGNIYHAYMASVKEY